MTTAEKLILKGRKEGRQEGHKEGKFDMMLYMIRNARKNGLTEDMIANIVNLDIDSVRRLMNNEPIDIPLHLLAADADQ